MPKLNGPTGVGIYTRDWKKAKAFYTESLGLTVRAENPSGGYLALGAAKEGPDAALDVWQPSEMLGRERFETASTQIGGVTGVGFTVGNLAKTLEALRARGVTVEAEGESPTMARFTDPDGNILFLSQGSKKGAKVAGLTRLEWVTVVTRDQAKADAFFTKALGMKKETMAEEGMTMTFYRLGAKGTSIMPFVPTREMYDDPKGYDEDMAHVGEDTSITFRTDDIQGLQESLMARGVRFTQKAEKQPWGGWTARFLDPDGNVYTLAQQPA